MRKILAILVLAAVAAAVWLGGRWFVHRGEVKATIVVDDARALRAGDPVLDGQEVAGRVLRVERIDDRAAITVRLARDHRRSIVTDSLFAVEDHALVVSNTFAVGRPVENGAILYPRQDRITTWLARHGDAVKPYLDKARSRADQFIDHDFDNWTARLPEWKHEGNEAIDRHVAEVRQRVNKAEAQLRAANRLDEARKLKQRFEQWLAELKR